MTSNGYQIALEHAKNEIAEINAQLEKLAQRKHLIEKLVEMLVHVDPQSGPVDTLAKVPDEPVQKAAAPDVAEHEAAAHDAQAPEAAVDAVLAVEVFEIEADPGEATAADATENKAAVEEAPVEVDIELEELEGYEESEAQPEEKISAVAAAENGHPPSYDQVSHLAYLYWIERGYAHGHQEQDWLRAEEELRGVAT
jgi:Protein of unknown function (DUF2934)